MIEKDLYAIKNMKKHGGSFVKALAECALHADSTNYRKMTNVWADYFEQYREHNWKK
jgi:hypothetical protein